MASISSHLAAVEIRASRTSEAVPFRPLSAGRIPSLDGLRAVSIAMVVGFHWLNAVTRPRTGADYSGPWNMLLNGELGVSIFFVISGFLITHLLLREREKTGTLNLGAFYIRRSFRIWPAFFLYIAAIVALRQAGVIGLSKGNLLAAATFTFNYAPHVGSWWVGHTWSLSLEEQFYLLWPMAVLLLSRRNAGRLAIGLLVFTPLVRLAETALLPGHSLLVTHMWQMTHTRVDTLMCGCILALSYHDRRFQSVIRFCEAWGVTAAAGMYLLASPLIESRLPHLLSAAVGFSMQGICVALIIAWAVRHEHALFGKLLNAKAVVHLGQISFSLYLWQQLFFVSLNHSWTGRFPMNLLLAIALAEGSFFLIERPFLRLRQMMMQPRRVANV